MFIRSAALKFKIDKKKFDDFKEKKLKYQEDMPTTVGFISLKFIDLSMNQIEWDESWVK